MTRPLCRCVGVVVGSGCEYSEDIGLDVVVVDLYGSCLVGLAEYGGAFTVVGYLNEYADSQLAMVVAGLLDFG